QTELHTWPVPGPTGRFPVLTTLIGDVLSGVKNSSVR
ncbi:hypothetical protein A2U01_0103020, partial [Trifolium medium]|nr:hypothetical protein [Trifolium medium]